MSRVTRVVLLGMGSRGDVQPFVALGSALTARGYAVTVVAPSDFRDFVIDHGADFEALSFGLQEGIESELGRAWLGGSSSNQVREARMMKRVVRWTSGQLADDLERLVAGVDVVVSSSLTVDAVDALVEGTATVHVCALFQPLWPSAHGPSATFALLPGSSAVNTGWGWLARRATWDIVRPAGDLLRRRRGLRRRGHRGYAAALRRTPTLLAASSDVVPPAPDWPAALRQTGFWFRSDPGEAGVEERLRAFVETGSPPVYVGFGSMPTGDPDRLLADVVTALDARGVRGVIGSGLAGLGRTPPAGLPDSVLVVDAAPHEWLFPRCAAVVHHGGAGTTAAALRAGVPQVVVPHIADQPYWGRRVHDLGVGPAPVARKDLTAARLAAALGLALADETRSAAYLLGALISAEDGVGDAAQLLDAHVQMRAASSVP
ncbi:MAG: glycosyltransferase [Terracoccus sp.]